MSTPPLPAALPVAKAKRTRPAKKSRKAANSARAISLAGFDFAALNHQYSTIATPINDASNYGVAIQPATVAASATYWKAVGIHHLTPDENRSRHNIFLDVLNESGERVREALIGWTWEGNQEPPPPKALDKPDNEPGADIPIFDGLLRVWVQGSEPSDTVTGLHYRHADERNSAGEILNSHGHHSFYVVFQRMRNTGATDPNVDGGEVTTPVKPATPDEPIKPIVRWIGVVTAAALNVRSGPGVDQAVVGSLINGNQVQVVEQIGDWLRIVWNDATAFINAQFVVNRDASPVAIGEIFLPPSADHVTVAVANTWNRYRTLIERESARLGIDPAVAVALLVAESNGAAFGPDGRLIIRFENHIFYDQWGKQNAARFQQHFLFDPTMRQRGHHWRADSTMDWQRCHTSQAMEWQVLDFARTLDSNAALRSISMGAPQIMGFNHQRVGYGSAQEMLDAFQRGDEEQLGALFRFLEVNGLVEAARQGDLRRIALVYNGSNQADSYAEIIQRNLAAFRVLSGGGSRGISQAAAIFTTTELAEQWQQQFTAGLLDSRTIFTKVVNDISAGTLEDAIQAAQLGIVLNTYWAQLAWINDPVNAQSILQSATNDALLRLRDL